VYQKLGIKTIGVKSMMIGYARVSTEDQSLETQTRLLEGAGCNRIFSDKLSGSSTKGRVGLEDAMSALGQGDTLVVWKLDRLGRSVSDLIAIVQKVEMAGATFKSLTDAIDTSSPSGRFFFHMMGALAQMERELIAERTKAGLETARKEGRVGGRPPVMTPNQARHAMQLISAGESPRAVARSMGVGSATLYRYIKKNAVEG
jgi:DNA invertase Pin-like site-specific DNA recombinase